MYGKANEHDSKKEDVLFESLNAGDIGILDRAYCSAIRPPLLEHVHTAVLSIGHKRLRVEHFTASVCRRRPDSGKHINARPRTPPLETTFHVTSLPSTDFTTPFAVITSSFAGLSVEALTHFPSKERPVNARTAAGIPSARTSGSVRLFLHHGIRQNDMGNDQDTNSQEHPDEIVVDVGLASVHQFRI